MKPLPAHVPPAPPDVRRIRTEMGLTVLEFSRLTGYSVRAIANWEAGEPLSGASLRRMQEFGKLQEALCGLAQPDSVGPWLLTPNPGFGGLKPLEVIERGEIHRIWQMVYWLQSGDAS